MKRLILLMLMLPAVSFSQEIEGKWSEVDSPNKTIEFRTDGIVEYGNVGQPKRITGKSFIKYSTAIEEGISYIIFEYHLEGHPPDFEKCKYILDGDKLTIFYKGINYENITTSPSPYKIIGSVYTRVK